MPVPSMSETQNISLIHAAPIYFYLISFILFHHFYFPLSSKEEALHPLFDTFPITDNLHTLTNNKLILFQLHACNGNPKFNHHF